MTTLPRVRPGVLFAVLLCACASSFPGGRAWEDAERAEACDSAEVEQCVVVACEGEDCGLFDCADVDLEALAEAPVELAQGYSRPPHRAPAFRNWRNTGIRAGARPRMTFHFRYRQGFLPALPREPGKLVHHHLFPQQPLLARWFLRCGVDIHKFTILIPEHIHRQIHSGTGRGGLWNQAWRDYHASIRGRTVTPEELHRKAVELIFRFELTGPVVPYNAPMGPFQSLPSLKAP
ncbi:SitA6 family polymorphic toxin lipoprotein [Pyxidicoccus xibeiensis]|uniref:SitA6 family polymorphic toxin lipoprotein n=1 Tax=Pyxidicoccus xibeiensis TaxID=2906759 RepID=UPI0020A7D869|nr:TIGR02269 family lipoprotein [Pyxidicoccus xibeiensis]MCP3135739.1 TIGR02269 family lipoprotein [Pyxidicoccus xibeiensis]